MCRQCVVECGFVWGIGAVALRVASGWNRCSEPSQALRTSSPVGRAKGLVGVDGQWESKGAVGIDGRSDKLRFYGCRINPDSHFGVWKNRRLR